jgi:uncharacterized membrane protein YkvA (DUF1232 family)
MRQLLENGRLVLRLLQDNRVPTWLKVGIPLIVAVYFLSPIDLIPDFIIGPGQLDDLGVVLLGMNLLVKLAPQSVVDEHKRALGYEVAGGYSPPPSRPASAKGSGESTIEGEYRILPTDVEDNRTRKF